VAEKPEKDKDKSVDELFDEDFAEVQAELEAEEKAVKDKPVQEEAESPESPVKEEVVEEVSSKDVGEVADDAEITTDEEVEEVVEKAVKKKAARLARREEKYEEHIFIIPLKYPPKMAAYKRAKRSVGEVRKYLARHTKTQPEDIHIDSSINEIIWARGGKHVPPRIRVRAMKFEDGVVEAEALTE
jgi:large subunit ribosomal protein L31e